MYIEICIYAGPNLGASGLLSGPSRGYYLVQVCFFAYFVVSSDFCALSYHFVCFWCPIIWQFSKNSLLLFNKRVQFLFSALSLNIEFFRFAKTL